MDVKFTVLKNIGMPFNFYCSVLLSIPNSQNPGY
jgi:hypothetical protein